MHCILLPAGAQESTRVVMCRPNVNDPQAVLGNGVCYSQTLKEGVQLYWQQSHLSIEHNALASALSGSPICGDAVAVVPEDYKTTIDELMHRWQQHQTGTELSVIDEKDHSSPKTTEFPPWEALPGELLGNIVRLGGLEPELAQAMSRVCSSWRASMAGEKCMFQSLKFNNLYSINKSSKAELPWVVQQALAAQNLNATVLAGRYYYAKGYEKEAKKQYMRAARMGHAEGSWRIGTAYYNGTMTLQQDSEQALLWLSRAARALNNHLTEDSSKSATSHCHLMAHDVCCTALRECSHIIGVINLDGDCIQRDSSAAIRYFQISHQYGCIEAGRMLQSLFRSGQY